MIVSLQEVCKDYEQGGMPVPAVKNVSLELDQGEYLAIMGPSGSGKTTLMNLIGCLDAPTSGKYLLDGVDVSQLDDKQMAKIRNKKIGFVFQGFNLLSEYDALDNVALPLLYAGIKKAERREMARQALASVGLEDRLHFRPNQLSGGQQQRVAIARAIVHKPKLLLADEPTGALDSASGEQLMGIFEELHQSGSAIIMITHERSIAEYAQRILYIKDGEISGGARRRDIQ
ncbi:MAG TPA: ABC transporter ATP-binding protein [Clostridia bacterium]|nr:ABC transporter ATP-binding protein [Clostridia bacterium]